MSRDRSPQAPARRRPAARRAARASDPRPGRGAALRPGRARPRPGQERPLGRRRRLRHAGGRARRDAAGRDPAGRPRLLAVPEPCQHRRAAPPDPPPPGLPAGAGPAAAARLVRGDLRPADRGRADARGSARRHLLARDRAGADGPPDRDRPPHAAAEVRPHRPGAGREGPARPDAVGARDRRRDDAPRDCRLLGDGRDPAGPADAARRGPRRPARVRADALAGAAALPARAGPGPDPAHRLRPAARGLADPLRHVDRGRSRRQPQRHART